MLNNKLFRYITAGGLSYALELASILALVHIFKTSSLAAVAIAFWIGLLVSFVLQKIFTFSNKTPSSRTAKQLTMYLILVSLNYAFTLGLVAALDSILDVSISRTIALIVTTAWNFIIYSKIIFRK